MSNYLRKYILLLGGSVIAVTLTACVTDRHESLRMSASRLDDSSSHFYAQIQYQGDDSRRDRISRDAEELSHATHKLDRDLNAGELHGQVDDDYRHVEDNYEQLHKDLADEGYAEQNRQLLADFDRVTAAYRDVQSAMAVRTADVR